MKVITNKPVLLSLLLSGCIACFLVFNGCIDTAVKETGNVVYRINYETCTACGDCIAPCPENAISLHVLETKQIVVIDAEKCIGCGICADHCPVEPKALNKEDIQ